MTIGECKRPGCEEVEDRIDGYCSVYCKDVDDLRESCEEVFICLDQFFKPTGELIKEHGRKARLVRKLPEDLVEMLSKYNLFGPFRVAYSTAGAACGRIDDIELQGVEIP